MIGPAEAQSSKRRVAIVFPIGRPEAIRATLLVSTFLGQLASAGYHEGKEIEVSILSGNGEIDDYPKLAERAVAEGPDLIFVNTITLARQVRATTSAVPIVACVNDPQTNGLIPDPAVGKSNVTGVDVNGGSGLYAARLDVLRQAGLKFIKPAFITPSLFDLRNRLNELRATWKNIIPVQIEAPINEGSLRIAFKVLAEEGADALLVSNSNLLATFAPLIISLAREHRLPAAYPYRSYVEAGGLMSYGMDFAELGRAAGRQVEQIFNGVSPGDIPFFRSTDFELALNLKAARSLNVTIAQSVVARAGLVIE